MMLTNRKIRFKEQCDGILGKILKNIGDNDSVWYIESDGIVSQSSDTGYLFEKEEYNNDEFHQTINKKDYYTTSAQIELYNKENIEDKKEIHTYANFIKSKCDFIVFIIWDLEIIIISKKEELINQVDKNIKEGTYEVTMVDEKEFFKSLHHYLI